MGIMQVLRKLSIVATLTLPFSAIAGPITTEGGDTPEMRDGFVMNAFDERTLHRIELMMPERTTDFSLWVGASFSGCGWIEATGSCSTINKIIVGRPAWGNGNFGINQNPSPTTVPEPGTIGLLGLGLLGLALTRRRSAKPSVPVG
jgi:hypothetical protein